MIEMSHQFAFQDCSKQDIWRAKRIQVRLLRTEKSRVIAGTNKPLYQAGRQGTGLYLGTTLCSGDKNELDTARRRFYFASIVGGGRSQDVRGRGEVLVVWWDDGGDDYDDSHRFRYLGLGVGWLRVLASLVAGQGPGVVSPGDSELRQLSLPHSLD